MLIRIEGIAARLLGFIAGLALFAMMLLTFFDVIGRYGFHKSIFGVAEIIEFLMMVTVFAGLAFLNAKNEHITVTLLEGPIRRYMELPQRALSIAMSLGCTALITWHMATHGLDLLKSGKRTAVLDLPQWIQPGIAAVLSVAGLALLGIAVVRTRGRIGAGSLHSD